MSTIKEVAKIAGVSIGTVSHFLGGSVPVSDQLRKRISAAIQTLDYHPNHVARSLKTSKTRTIGLIVPDFGIPFFSKVIRSAEAAARVHGYSLMAVSSEDDTARQEELVLLLRSQRVEGILLVSASGQGSHLQIRKLVKSGIPVVCLDRLPDDIDVDSVCVEDRTAAETGVSHLISMGHQSIAMVTGPLTLRNERERLLGYKKAMQRSGMKAPASFVWECDFQQEHIREVCKAGLIAANRPTALFCSNGVVALGALGAIAACGLATPNDIAFATFDELVEHEIFHPSITCVVQPAQQIGSCAAEILIQRIKAPSAGPIQEVRLPATLKIGESSSGYRRMLARVAPKSKSSRRSSS